MACVKLHIQCNLVITASSGMKTFSGIANAFDQMCLHKAVNVLVLCSKGQSTVVNVLTDALQSLDDAFFILVRQNTLFGKHGYMGNASLDVFFVEFLVKGKRCVKIVYKLICFLGETSAPKLHNVLISVLRVF